MGYYRPRTKVNDKGGISPWTTSNKYDVKVPYAITKSTPTIPYISQVSTPTSKVTEIRLFQLILVISQV